MIVVRHRLDIEKKTKHIKSQSDNTQKIILVKKKYSSRKQSTKSFLGGLDPKKRRSEREDPWIERMTTKKIT